MTVVVLGASGRIGRELTDRLTERGVEVVAAQRSTGVDALTGVGLAEAFAGATVVVDCMNKLTVRAGAAIDFFSTVARNVSAAAVAAGVDRVVCVSIINAADPAVNAKFGYYQGKAAQEKAYRDALGDRVTLFRSAQWYELAATMLGTASIGPVAGVPHMRCQPLSAADAGTALADAVTEPSGDVEVAGPDVLDLADVARAIAHRKGSPRWVFGLPVGGAAVRNGGLVPSGPGTIIAPTNLAAWLDEEYPS